MNGVRLGVLAVAAAILPVVAAACGGDSAGRGHAAADRDGVDDHHDLHHHDDGQAYYIVKQGDTLGKIAKAFQVRLADLMAINGITNPDDIQAGQELQIPTGAIVVQHAAYTRSRHPRRRRLWAMSFWPTPDHWSVQIPLHTPHPRLAALADTGFVALADADFDVPEDEYLALEYMDWKSGGDTNFAPLASADGELDCRGFWDKGKTDKDALWTSNAAIVARRCSAYVDSRRRQLRSGAGDQARAAGP